MSKALKKGAFAPFLLFYYRLGYLTKLINTSYSDGSSMLCIDSHKNIILAS